MDTFEGLANAGFAEINTAYYEPDQTPVQKFPVKQRNVFRQPFNNLTLGAAGNQMVIPATMAPLVKRVSITLQLPANSGSGTSSSYYGLSVGQGWGYQLIRNIRWKIGGSKEEQKAGINHCISLMAKCETQDKQLELMNLGGYSLLTTNSSNDFSTYPDKLTAYCHLDLPFSDVRALFTRRPLDSRLTTGQNIVIWLDLSPANAVISQSTVNSVAPAALPTQLSAGEWLVELLEMPDAFSIEKQLLTVPDAWYAYPALWEMSGAQTLINQPYTYPNRFTTMLSGFQAGQLLGIQVFAVRNGDLSPGGVVNPYNLVELTDLTLSYTGTDLAIFPGKSYQLAHAVHTMRPSYIPQQVLSVTPSTGYSAAIAKSYFVMFDLSQYSVFAPTDLRLQYGENVGTGQINLTLSTPVGDSASTSYTLFVTYFYTESIEFARGVVKYVM